MAFLTMAYVFSMWPFFIWSFFHAANIPVTFFPMTNKFETQVSR